MSKNEFLNFLKKQELEQILPKKDLDEIFDIAELQKSYLMTKLEFLAYADSERANIKLLRVIDILDFERKEKEKKAKHHRRRSSIDDKYGKDKKADRYGLLPTGKSTRHLN